MQRKGTLSLAVAAVLAGGTFCYGQQQAADRAAGAVDRAAGAAGAAAAAAGDHAASAMGGKQIDQQVDQQLQRIQQQKDQMAGDRLFVLEAGLGGHFEVALAQQALQKSQDPQVKQIAQRIIQDHQQANQQLMTVAQKLQVEVPMGLTSMKQQKLQIIGSMDSKMYDQKFLACMDALHAHDVHEFRSTTVLAQSPDVKQFASQTLPKLQEHHQLIKQSATAMGLPAGMDAQPAGSRIPASVTPGAGGSGGTGSTPGGTGTGTGGSGNNVNGSRSPSGESAPGGRSNPGSDK